LQAPAPPRLYTLSLHDALPISVDPRLQRPEAVALVVLRPVGITRPEEQHERLAAIALEQRQNPARRHGREPLLLDDVGRERAGSRPGAGIPIVVGRVSTVAVGAGRGLGRDVLLPERAQEACGKRRTIRRAGR